MEMVFVLKETNLISGGENGFFVDLFDTDEKAYEEMMKNIEEHKENNNAYVIEVNKHGAELKDDEGNKHYFNIEEKTIN